MKRELYAACILLPLAALAGWLSAPSAAPGTASSTGSTAAEVHAPPPAKSELRVPREKRPPPPALTWKELRQRSGASTADLQAKLVELLNTRINAVLNGSEGWLLEYLLETDPGGTLRAIRDHCQDYQFGNVTRQWCRQHPEAALAMLLSDREFKDKSSSPFRFDDVISFDGMGALDPEKGLKMILDLPPDRQSGDYFCTLLLGISRDHPDQAADYFERIIASGKLPEQQLSELLKSFGAGNPAQAAAWAKAHFKGKIPAGVIAGLVESAAEIDLPAAMKFYDAMAGSGDNVQRQAAYWIANNLTDQGLDASWDWIEAHAPAANVEELKGNSWSRWAWSHRGEALDRIVMDPTLLGGQRGGEMLDLFHTEGRDSEVAALLGKLSADQLAKLQPILVENGMIPPSAEPNSNYEWFDRLNRDAATGGELLKSLPAERRAALAADLDTESNSSVRDPRLELEILGPSSAGPGAQRSLARLMLMDSDAAVRMVEAMPPGDQRTKAIKVVARNWAVDDSAAAAAWKEKMSSGK